MPEASVIVDVRAARKPSWLTASNEYASGTAMQVDARLLEFDDLVGRLAEAARVVQEHADAHPSLLVVWLGPADRPRALRP